MGFGAVRPEVMMVSVTRTLKRWGAALARRTGLDANPLRRGCDRAEAWVRLGLVLAFLIASPLAAIGLGHLTNDASVRAARAQRAAEYHVPAVLLHKVSRNSDDPLYATSQLAWARARWTAPDGQQRVGEVPAAGGQPRRAPGDDLGQPTSASWSTRRSGRARSRAGSSRSSRSPPPSWRCSCSA